MSKQSYLNFILVFTAASILALVLIWQACLLVFDLTQNSQTQSELEKLERYGSIFHWSFDRLTDVSNDHHLQEMSVQAGVLEAVSLDDPYFFLNLRGRRIDASRYQYLELKIYTEKPVDMFLFHAQDGTDFIYRSQAIPLEAGWQTRRIDLTAPWQVLQWFGDEPPTSDESSWGGISKSISQFRIDPLSAGSFKLDYATLKTKPFSAESLDPERFVLVDGKFKDVLAVVAGQPENRRSSYLVDDQRRGRTWETAIQSKETLLALDPSLLFQNSSLPMLDRPQLDRLGGSLNIILWILVCASSLIVLLPAVKVRASFRDLTKVVALFAAIQLVLWSENLLYSLILIPVLWISKPELARFRETLKALSFTRFSWPVILMTVLVAGIILTSNVKPPSDYNEVFTAFGIWFLWCSCQQVLLNFFVYPNLAAIGANRALFFTALFFGLIHFPNFALTSACFVLGLVWIDAFRRSGNIFFTVLSQAFLATLFQYFAPSWWRFSGTIGRDLLLQLNLLG